jgi:hypothetical protein
MSAKATSPRCVGSHTTIGCSYEGRRTTGNLTPTQTRRAVWSWRRTDATRADAARSPPVPPTCRTVADAGRHAAAARFHEPPHACRQSGGMGCSTAERGAGSQGRCEAGPGEYRFDRSLAQRRRPPPFVLHVAGDAAPNGAALQIEQSDQGPVDLCLRTQDVKKNLVRCS